MADVPPLDELERQLLAVAKLFYERGRLDVHLEVARLVGAPLNGAGAAKPQIKEAQKGGQSKRAPKGLSETTIKRVLEESPGLTMKEVQGRVAALERSVNAKTVYNILRTNKDNLYHNDGDRWFLVSSKHLEDSTSTGSGTETAAPPATVAPPTVGQF